MAEWECSASESKTVERTSWQRSHRSARNITDGRKLGLGVGWGVGQWFCRHLRRRRVRNNEEVMTAVRKWQRMKQPDSVPRLDFWTPRTIRRCINAHGDYDEQWYFSETNEAHSTFSRLIPNFTYPVFFLSVQNATSLYSLPAFWGLPATYWQHLKVMDI